MYYLCTRKKGFRSSVGLEQRPSKAWVQGSNPCRITKGNQFQRKVLSGFYESRVHFLLVIKLIRTIFQYGAIRKSNVMWSNFENANFSLRSGIFCQSGQKRT